MLDINQIQKDFPQLSEITEGKSIVYLDSAATTLKPKIVMDAVETFYQKECANIHRGIHTLSEISTGKYEAARDTISNFINSPTREQIIFTKGTTDSINLVARTWAEENLKPGDEILISYLEHHSNIVPWQMVCEKTGASLKVAPVNDHGEIIFDEYKKLLNKNTKLVSVNFISNALGTINPIKEMIVEAKKVEALFMIDAAQSAAHLKMDVQDLDCDFLAFSGHKTFGPTGTGILYGKADILNSMPPFEGGGDMIDVVTFEKTTYNSIPQKFEAGTPNIAGVIGMGAGIEYINSLGLDNIAKYEDELLSYATEKLSQIEELTIIGTAEYKSAVISFVIKDIHPHDIATMANKYGLALRTGHHCTQPLMKRMGVPATARASFSIYNTKEDIDKLVEILNKIIDLFS